MISLPPKPSQKNQGISFLKNLESQTKKTGIGEKKLPILCGVIMIGA